MRIIRKNSEKEVKSCTRIVKEFTVQTLKTFTQRIVSIDSKL